MFETLRQNTAYRSVRYSTIRKDSYTADKPTRLSQFRVKHKFGEESTFYKTRTIDVKAQSGVQPSFANPERHSYMDTFHSLFRS